MYCASVHDSYYPVRTSVDIPYTDDYDAGAYEYNTPYLDTTELAEVHANSEEQWEIEELALAEDWDSYPDFQPPPENWEILRGYGEQIQARPANDIDWSEANHVYLGSAAMAWLAVLDAIRFRTNYNPPKKRMGSKTVPVHKKEVPVKSPQKPLIPIMKEIPRKMKRVPADELPVWLYRGWKEVKQ